MTGTMRPSVVAVLLLLLSSTAVRAAVFQVDRSDDDPTAAACDVATPNDCSLRGALLAANARAPEASEVTLPAGTYTLAAATSCTFPLPSGGSTTSIRVQLCVTASVKITGAGASSTIIDGNLLDRALFVSVGSEVEIAHVTIQRGKIDFNSPLSVGGGGGIRNEGTLRVVDSVVTSNFGSDVGGGISNAGSLTVERSEIRLNRADFQFLGYGGGIFQSAAATLTVIDSTIRDNEAFLQGGGVFSYGRAEIRGSAIYRNSAIELHGGGIAMLQAEVGDSPMTTITNSTISDNRAGGSGGGISLAGPDIVTLHLQNVTITRNGAGDRRASSSLGGGIFFYSTGNVTARNTIIAGNSSVSTLGPDCGALAASSNFTLVSEGHNLIGNTKDCYVSGDTTGNVGNVDPRLAALVDNGGPTATHALLSNSPAIDAGDPDGCTDHAGGALSADQRGSLRPADGDDDGTARCDIGAFELQGGQAGGPTISRIRPSKGGNAGTVQATVYGSGFADGATVTLFRNGFADVAGASAAVGVDGATLTAPFDLRGAAPGLWGIRVENPDTSVVTLADAFTIEAGGTSDLWVEIVMPRAFIAGRFRTFYLVFGNRGTVDAHAVPIWLSFPDELEWHIPFPVSAPPAQPGQIATDWTRIAIDAPVAPPADRDTFPFLLPVVPAGSTGTLTFRLRAPLSAAPERLPFRLEADVGTPHFQPELSAAVLAEFVARAKDYADTAHGTTSFPPDAAIEQYVLTQLATVVAEGRADAVAHAGGHPPVYSQQQLVIDTGQFIAGESATAAAPFGRRWLARLIAHVLPAYAEARIVNPDCPPGDRLCERETPDCDEDPDACNPDPPDCTDIPALCDPRFNCDRVLKFGLSDYAFVPCAPETIEDRDLGGSIDPNDKVGPGSPNGSVDGITPILYNVFFENLPTASADAFEVSITDQLDAATLDLATFSLGQISFGDTFVPVPPGLQNFVTEVDLRPRLNILVGIEAGLDTGTGIVTWKFTTLDPATHEFPEDPEDGFLPPNVTSPEGEGAVLFTVSPKPGLGLGTEICNDASIVFDFNAPIVTPEWCNVIELPTTTTSTTLSTTSTTLPDACAGLTGAAAARCVIDGFLAMGLCLDGPPAAKLETKLRKKLGAVLKTLDRALVATAKKRVRLQRAAVKKLAAVRKRATALAGKKLSEACATRISGVVGDATQRIEGS